MRKIRTLVILFTAVCILGNTYKTLGQGKVNYNDTSVLKHLKWNALNEYVSYHIIEPGKSTNNSKLLMYKFKKAAIYHYFNKSYEADRTDTGVTVSPTDLTKLLLSNKFSSLRGLDVIFKVNSKVAFVREPQKIFQKLSIRPKVDDEKLVKQVMMKLERENFVNRVHLDTFKMFKSLNGSIQVFITFKLKQEYMNVKAVTAIRKKLKKWAGVNEVISSMDMFQGYSERDIIYRITSL